MDEEQILDNIHDMLGRGTTEGEMFRALTERVADLTQQLAESRERENALREAILSATGKLQTVVKESLEAALQKTESEAG